MRRSQLRFAILTVTATLLFGACNGLDTFTFQKADDRAITSGILAKLYQDTVLKTRDIHVVSQKGVVVLTGNVANESERAQAERLASQESGVKQVINQLAMSGISGAATAEAPAQPAAPSAPPAASRLAARDRSRPTRHYDDAAPPRASEVAATQRVEPIAAPTPSAAASAVPSAPPPKPAEPARVTVPAGTVITVRLIDAIDTSRNHAGEEFAATVEAPVVVGDRVVIPRNSDARLRLVEARSAGHISGRSELVLELVKIGVGNNTYPVETGVQRQEGGSRGKRTAETVGGGAGLGALIGAVAGKGKGAAIGAAVGAGAGTAVQAATHGQQVRIPSETKLDFTLRAPITVTL